MTSLQPWITWLVLLVSNCGFWLFCFNQTNAAGWERKFTKRLEKLWILLCFATPATVWLVDAQPLSTWLAQSNHWWPSETRLFAPWALGCLISLLSLFPVWLESRRWIWPPDNLLQVDAKRYHVPRLTGQSSTADWKTELLNRIPGNEITQLEVNRKQLRLPRCISGIDGLTIAHISDVHFTGQLAQCHYHFMIDRLLEQQPDLIVITGDIIDKSACLSWIEPVLGRLTAPLGITFLLGNHDQRIARWQQVTEPLSALGFFDLGIADQRVQLPSGAKILLTGNELPWFERHASPPLQIHPIEQDTLRLGLSHSPDQINWARNRQLDLLLAGHTHGGQVRLPGIGPLVSPSHYGSRFASGVFYRQPVLMHVSRGIAGTHPLRYRCPPEVSLLVLRSPDTRPTNCRASRF